MHRFAGRFCIALWSYCFAGTNIFCYSTPETLIEAIEKAASLKERASLVASLGDDQHALETAAIKASQSSRESAHIVAAMLLPLIKNQEVVSQIIRQIEKSPSEEASRIVKIEKLLKCSNHIGLRRDSLKSKDPHLRITSVLTTNDLKEIFDASVDSNALVRAASALRYATIGAKLDGNREIVSVQFLVDPSAIVRSIALPLVIDQHISSEYTLRGLLFDPRPVISFQAVFADDPEGVKIRSEYGLGRDYTWSFHRLEGIVAAMDGPLRLFPLAPTQRLDEPLLIGSLAAHALKQSNVDIAGLVNYIDSLPISPLLRRQIRETVSDGAR